MEVLVARAELAGYLERARRDGATVALVPTMGALHAGHGALFSAARRRCDVVAASVFVNPLQFGPGEDYESYPRDLGHDVGFAEASGVDVLFAPSLAEMYPDGGRAPVVVDPGPLGRVLEGASRPGHFVGVATVLAKLFAVAGPCTAFFGEKDYQQLLVVRRLVEGLSFPVEVVGCPVVREPDGLALSSRNARLAPELRSAAPVLYRALQAGRDAVEAGERDPLVVERVMAETVAKEPAVELDYGVVRVAADLEPLAPLSGELRLLVAARLGGVRLIDNLGATVRATARGETGDGRRRATHAASDDEVEDPPRDRDRG
jgi:pantoate--beta-alanine ligase